MKPIVALLPALLLSAPVTAETVTFAGSTTILPILEAMTPVFNAHDIEPEIQAGGSSAGFKAAKMGMANIGMMTRELKEAEAKDVNNVVIARDWVVMIANKDAPFDGITSQQVVDIYTGKTDELDGYKINALDKEVGGGTKTRFDSYFDVVGKTASDLIIIAPSGQTIATLAGDPNGLAYLGYGYTAAAIEKGEPIKILELDGVAPTPENVQSGAYTVTRNMNLVYTDKNAEVMERVKKVLATPEAKEVFLEMGVSPAL
ncbi:MAG: substrate-binding domain-containing protein [Thiohalocapsa sp.]